MATPFGSLRSTSAFVRARVQAALYHARKRRLAREAAMPEPPEPPEAAPEPDNQEQ